MGILRAIERLVKMSSNEIVRLQQQRGIMDMAATEAAKSVQEKLTACETELQRERRRTVELANERNALKIQVGSLTGQLDAKAAECDKANADLARMSQELEAWKSAKAGFVAQPQRQGGGKGR